MSQLVVMERDRRRGRVVWHAVAGRPEVRAAMAKGARAFCEREHAEAIAAGRAPAGVPCCPHCTVVKAVAG